jgi:hypothetical protein
MKAVESWSNFAKRLGLNKPKEIRMKDISRKVKHRFLREALAWHPQHNHHEKYFIIERLRYLGFIGRKKDISNIYSAKKGNIEYRIGYYIVGKNGNKKGKWTWGQYCPMIPKEDYQKLMKKAGQEKVILK